MLIGELSRRTGVRTHQLRYYESQGLLQPRRGRHSGYREYTDEAVLTVHQIRRLLEAGLSTDDIAYLLPCVTGPTPEMAPCQEIVDTLRARLATLDDRLNTLAGSRESLAAYISATEQRLTQPA
ncbi:MerR family transcriptional regulator [Yinghuangia aomiensis]|uniref:MerR family transcriptional regulator n=1 Tax=Yinghuangia aomiensis TaxID=676205 RepID=A0ABP9H358_9ACTN